MQQLKLKIPKMNWHNSFFSVFSNLTVAYSLDMYSIKEAKAMSAAAACAFNCKIKNCITNNKIQKYEVLFLSCLIFLKYKYIFIRLNEQVFNSVIFPIKMLFYVYL